MWARIIDGGGRNNFVYLAEPTCLHFRAIWKTERNAGPAELNVWKVFHQSKNFTPAGMKVPVCPGRTEQETFWKVIAPAPDRWTQELRTAVHVILDRRISLHDEVTLQSFEHTNSGKVKLQKLTDDVKDLLRWVVWEAASRWRSVKRSLRNSVLKGKN
jgi:hypothetical protein